MTELSAEMLAAILTDDAKAARLTELLAQEKANKAILAEAQAKLDAAAAAGAEAVKTLAQAERVKAETAARQAKLEADEHAAEQVLAALNAEKDAFNLIRTQVEDDLARRKDIVNAKGEELAARETDLANREAHNEAREHLAKDCQSRALKLHHAIEAAIDEHRAA